MPKGGARVNSGPPPDPNALRRDRPSDKAGWTILPANGYQGPLPKWPLIPDVVLTTKRDSALKLAERLADELAEEKNGRRRAAKRKELDGVNEHLALLDKQLEVQQELEDLLWSQLWRLPQACVWVQQGWLRDVAQYARHKVRAELGSLDDAKEARQWSDRLGLNPAAMLRNRWKVAAADDAPKTDEQPTGSPATTAAKPRRPSARDRMRVVRSDDENES